MEIDVTPDTSEVIKILQNLTDDQAKELLVRKCPQCDGRGYSPGYKMVGKTKPRKVYDSHIQCNRCNGVYTYRETSELAKVLLQLITDQIHTVTRIKYELD